jgi:alpha-beta hydrolase superfamily lysophospholipase
MPHTPYEIETLAATPRAAVVIVHGLAEHAARYRTIADEFAARGIATFAFDQRGHGLTKSARTHVERFDDFVDEAIVACETFAARHPSLPLFVWGHSMGSIVAVRLAARGYTKLAGLIVSSSSLEVFKAGPNPLHPLFQFASRVVPRLRIRLGLDAKKISHDEAVQRAYANDPLVPSTASLRLIVEFAQACELARSDAPAIRLPTLIVHGEHDEIAPARGSQVLYDALGSSDKTLKIYPGLRHEVHNERAADRAMFVELVVGWVLARVDNAARNVPPSRPSPATAGEGAGI